MIVTSGGFKDELEVWSSKDNIDITKLSSTHEAADTRLILHAINCKQKYIIVQSKDTDVLVLLISLFYKINCIELWMKAGTKKNPKFIPVHDVVNSISPTILKSLIPFHTLTGCDTTSFIAQHTKWSAWKTLLSHSHLIEHLGENDNLEDTEYKNIEKFFCILYGIPNEDNIDKVRYHLFLKKNKPDALPPTSDALYLHIKRAHYQSLIWKKADCPRPIIPDPTNYGWETTDTGLKPILMTKEGIPMDALKIQACTCQTNCETNRCGCKKKNIPCSINCSCTINDIVCCRNSPESIDSEDED